MTSLTELFGEELLGKAGPVKTSDALAGKKNVMIYFSAHSCPHCRKFTPQLAERYFHIFAADIEIIFVSSDQYESSFNSYYGEMPWLALPFSERSLRDSLAQKFDVKGMPTLVLLGDEGTLVATEGPGRVDEFLRAMGGGSPPAGSQFCTLFYQFLFSRKPNRFALFSQGVRGINNKPDSNNNNNNKNKNNNNNKQPREQKQQQQNQQQQQHRQQLSLQEQCCVIS
ncbi:unnamed protein product [Polarella glacialis]|uniref:protein-disulfide reductase n=1 Tax=Polarella glacialis TaxID=89957 RepID=A0A813D7P8_POLGL|nr:unnamed protein product [Polarella glacialis]